MVLATECTLAVEPLFGTAKGVRGNLPPPRHARTLFLPMLTALGARVCRVEAPPAKEPEAGAGRGGAASSSSAMSMRKTVISSGHVYVEP